MRRGDPVKWAQRWGKCIVSPHRVQIPSPCSEMTKTKDLNPMAWYTLPGRCTSDVNGRVSHLWTQTSGLIRWKAPWAYPFEYSTSLFNVVGWVATMTRTKTREVWRKTWCQKHTCRIMRLEEIFTKMEKIKQWPWCYCVKSIAYVIITGFILLFMPFPD